MNDDQELHGLYIAYDELCRQEREAELHAEMRFEVDAQPLVRTHLASAGCN